MTDNLADANAPNRPTRKPQVLKGFRDYLPGQMLLRQRIIALFREVFERHGFEPLDTPVLEYLEILTGKAGENEKLMYHFADQGGREIGLRYDLTVPLARVVAMHQNDLVFPFKRYHIAPVWRAEKPQRGRFREFWQCDADIAGSASMLADAEVVSIMAEALTAVGLPNFTILINDRRLLEALAISAGVPNERATTIYRAIDKLGKIGRDGVGRELAAAGVEASAIDRVLDLVTLTGQPDELLAELRSRLADIPRAIEAVDELGELFAYLPSFGVKAGTYKLDLSLARGIDYYTGPVYEASVTEPNVGSVAGAGRYDRLVGTFLGRTVPATGISLGLERIIEVVEEFGLLPVPKTTAEVMVASFPDTISDAAEIATTLRQTGLHVDLSLQPNRGLGDQLRYAGRKEIPLVAIVGSEELAANEVTLRDLRSGAQERIGLSDLPGKVRELLAGDRSSGQSP